MSTISELQIKIGADSSGLSSSLNQAKTDIDKTFSVNPINEMNAAIGNLNGTVSGLIGKFNGLVGLAATGFGFTSLIEGAVNAGAGVYQMSQTLHESAGEAAEFNRILKLTGVETHLAETAFIRLDKTYTKAGDDGDKCRAIFKAVGVSLTDSSGKLLPINQQLEQLSAGYKKAAAAGMGQEFVLNTLGARGMELVKVLKNYDEAKNNSSKVQGVGLNPTEMYKMQQQLHLLSMQAGQLKLVFGSVFVDLIGGNVENISSGLAKIAKYIADNRQEITSTTGEVLKLLAAYESIKLISKVGGNVLGAMQTNNTKSQLNAINASNKAALTAQQERSIVKRQALIDAAAKKEEAAYYKTVQAMEASEAEKTAIFNEYLIKREQASLESQAAIRTSMTEMYLQSATVAEESATAQAAAMNNVAVAAEETAARIVTANVTEASSAVTVAEANIAKGSAATESGAESVLASEAATVANEALTTSEVTAGDAAVVAGGKKVEAATAATAATDVHTASNEALTVAEVEAGDTAVVAGSRMAEAAAVATGAVSRLTKAVFALAGGWYAVAAAIAYTMYISSQRSTKIANKVADDHVVLSDGTVVNGDDKGVYDYGDSVSDDVNNRVNTGDSYDNAGNNPAVIDTENQGTQDSSQPTDSAPKDNTFDLSDAQKEELANIRYQQWYNSNDSEAVAERARQESNAQTESMQNKTNETMAALAAALKDSNSGSKAGAGSGAAPAAKAPVTHEVQTPVGEVASGIAASHPDGEQWMGNITSDPSIQCDSFTANVYNQAGISSIGGVDTSSSTINDSAFKAAGAYHAVGDGYVPQNGDLVDFAGHVGIYKDGNVISRQSSGGVHTASMDDAVSYFGKVQGYGSVAEATGGQTVTQTVDADGKKIEDATAKLAKAKEDAYKLFNTMANKILEENGTTYENGMNKVNQDVQAKQQQINKLKSAGVDTSALEKELIIYKEVLDKDVVKAWHEAWFKIKDDTKKALDDVYGAYSDEAKMQYDATVRALDKEREERLKAIQQSSKDVQARLAVENWYNAQVLKAADDRDKALDEAHSKLIKKWEDEGQYSKILTNLKARPQSRQKDLDIEGQKKLAGEVVKIWDAAHQSIDANIAEAADNMYSSMTSSINGFIDRTKTAMDVVHDFGNTIMSEIERIASQRLAASIIGGLLGNVLSSRQTSSGAAAISGLSDLESSNDVSGMELIPFANGGIVTAPTVGLIGEAGVNEAVVPLTSDNLSKIGGNGSASKVVVNITNNSDAQPKVANQRYDSSLNRMVLDIVIDGAQRNVGGFNSNLKTALR